MSYRILEGDAMTMLRTLADESVQCVVTSPPYWGLRDYKIAPSIWPAQRSGARGQGSEQTPCAHAWQNRRYYTVQTAAASSGGAFSEPGAANAARLKKGRWRDNCWCQLCGAWRGALGLEPTPALYIEHMVAIFGEVRRVLRKDGTLWLNMGDSYYNGDKGGYERTTTGKQQTVRGTVKGLTVNRLWQESMKPKDLVGIPWMLAFALRADGWWLRQDIVWSKLNPMPESVTDRCTKAHEYLFLLTKSAKYFYDQEAIKEAALGESDHDLTGQSYEAPGQTRQTGTRDSGLGTKETGARAAPAAWDMSTGNGRHGTVHRAGRASGNKTHKTVAEYEKNRGPGTGNRDHDDHGLLPQAHRTAAGLLQIAATAYPLRNKRSVWEIATQPFPEAHFATFPEALVEPCILAGTSEMGCCPQCGAPWRRVRANGRTIRIPRYPSDDRLRETKMHGPPSWKASGQTTGWQPPCKCPRSSPNAAINGAQSGTGPSVPSPLVPSPCVILDCFCGAGTTGVVALRYGRDFIGIELNPEYAAMARRRIENDAPLFNKAVDREQCTVDSETQPGLFTDHCSL